MKTIRTICVAVACLGAFSGAAYAEGDTLKKIKETNAIVIGYRDSSIPFSYLDAQFQPVGFSMDLCKIVVERVKQQLDMRDLTVTTFR